MKTSLFLAYFDTMHNEPFRVLLSRVVLVVLFRAELFPVVRVGLSPVVRVELFLVVHVEPFPAVHVPFGVDVAPFHVLPFLFHAKILKIIKEHFKIISFKILNFKTKLNTYDR